MRVWYGRGLLTITGPSFATHHILEFCFLDESLDLRLDSVLLTKIFVYLITAYFVCNESAALLSIVATTSFGIGGEERIQ